MNDCRAVYRKVNHFVQCLYPGQLTGNLHRNMNTLSAMITGIILGKETQLPLIALNVPEEIKVPSTEKRFKRLLINEKITEQTYFLPFIQSVLINLGLEEMILAIDGSLVGRGCICLMISLIYKGRALPLVFTVVRGNKGHLPEDTHVELANKLRPLIPESTQQVIFLGDGEFDGTSLQKTLSSFGWKYVSRTSSNITVYVDDEPFQIEMLAAMLPKGHCKGLRNCQITHKKYGPVTVGAWWGDDLRAPVFGDQFFICVESVRLLCNALYDRNVFQRSEKPRIQHRQESSVLPAALKSAYVCQLFGISVDHFFLVSWHWRPVCTNKSTELIAVTLACSSSVSGC